MSSGGPLTPDRDFDKLAPKFRAAVQAALDECQAIGTVIVRGIPLPLDPYVWEGLRSPELQALYYSRGRQYDPESRRWIVIDRRAIVTGARSNLFSWHGYGLAVDIISAKHYWFARNRDGFDERPYAAGWYAAVANVFKRQELDWGGDWARVDTPHFQWGRLKASPSDLARKLIAQGGYPAVWNAVGAA